MFKELFSTDIVYCKGVGPKLAEVLKKEWDVNTKMDMLYKFPFRYVDRSKYYKIKDITSEDAYIQIIGQITEFRTVGEGQGKRLMATFTDGENSIDLVWFRNFNYLHYKTNTPYILFGKPTIFNHQYNFAHPDLEEVKDGVTQTEKGLQPEYNTTEKMKKVGLNSKKIRSIIKQMMPDVQNGIPETLGHDILQKYHLLNLTQSILNIHFPKDTQTLKLAQERLKFEELFYIQLDILHRAKLQSATTKGYLMPIVGKMFHYFYEHALPFALTNAQKRVIKEIQADLKSGKQMNRLLQGDVGSGKTLVALMSALLAIDNGFQTCIMAPTEILANQHYETISNLLKDMPLQVVLLTGSTTAKQRKVIHENLQNGEANIIIGTHALIEDNVQFANLGFVVIDEQHRFGVSQRAKLWSKNINPPHILVMTATPIPRTLAMTVYGDLDVSIIDELPPNRKPVYTLHYSTSQRQDINKFIVQQVELGRQIYIVYPLIKENEKLDLADLENGYQYIVEQFPKYRVSIVHGQMHPKLKEAEMKDFIEGKTQIMVATTVIEVGVNVPNASVMIIENAERFGLSQLHQLRGRVGRGAEQSFCILVTRQELGKDTRKRMDIMVSTNDGFRIAETDLLLRGPGAIDGTLQSGLPFDLKIASLAQDGQILDVAKEAATWVLEQDLNLSQPNHAVYKQQLAKLKRTTRDWSEIS